MMLVSVHGGWVGGGEYVGVGEKECKLTGDQQQFRTGASCSKSAFPSLCPWSLIS